MFHPQRISQHFCHKVTEGSRLNAAQCRMARAALQLGVRELAEMARVSPTTITKLERGETLYSRTVDAIQAALEAAGVEFIPPNGGGVGVRLKAG